MSDVPTGDRPAKSRGRRTGSQRRRRWPKRVLIVSIVVVLLAVGLGVGGYFYLGYQFNKIKKVTVHHLQKVPVPKPGKPPSPFTVLLVGSDSRAFVDTPGECVAYSVAGDCKESDTGGQRSDVTILVRVVPATHQIEMMSIPRDTWVAIPGHVPYISGENRINAAFNNGPSLLVETIEQDFHIPINYYVDVNFIGLQNMVDAIGGIHLDFPYPIRDAESGLDTLTTGCQIVHGGRALALVRSRNIEWEVSPGVWDNDPYSDFTRIRNQQTFFRAVIHQLNAEITNPFALNDFIGAAARNLTIDRTLTESTLISMAREFHNFPPGSLKTETLPTVGPYITDGGAVEALLPSAKADDVMIKAFLAFGTAKKTTATTTTTRPPATSTTTTPGGSSSTTTTTASNNRTTVTTVAPTPAGETPIYNNQSEPYDVKNC